MPVVRTAAVGTGLATGNRSGPFLEANMVIITVSGAHGGVGKTSLCTLLLGRMDGFAAIKVSSGGMYASVTDDEETIREEGKDTRAMWDAGARPVVLVKCPDEDLQDALEQAFVLLGEVSGVIVEGNGPSRLLKSKVSFFVTGPGVSDAKPGALELLKKADVVVVNVEDDEPPEKTANDIRSLNPNAAITTMGRLKRGSPELDELLRAF